MSQDPGNVAIDVNKPISFDSVHVPTQIAYV